MLDGDVLPQHDDPLDKQADEPLAPGEVERLQAVPDGRGEGLELGPQPLHACTLGVLRLQVFDSRARGLERGLQPLAPHLEFLYFDGALLVGVDEPLNLPLQVPAGPFQSGSLLVRGLRILTALLPGF
ncbi:hypothetical protein ACN28I_44935 [Archangium gephyra]|uniref:hypothetical protein n=1 Tax=Archangium gephyra TaxID=48 RepID=UPI003B802D30